MGSKVQLNTSCVWRAARVLWRGPSNGHSPFRTRSSTVMRVFHWLDTPCTRCAAFWIEMGPLSHSLYRGASLEGGRFSVFYPCCMRWWGLIKDTPWDGGAALVPLWEILKGHSQCWARCSCSVMGPWNRHSTCGGLVCHVLWWDF